MDKSNYKMDILKPAKEKKWTHHVNFSRRVGYYYMNSLPVLGVLLSKKRNWRNHSAIHGKAICVSQMRHQIWTFSHFSIWPPVLPTAVYSKLCTVQLMNVDWVMEFRALGTRFLSLSFFFSNHNTSYKLHNCFQPGYY